MSAVIVPFPNVRERDQRDELSEEAVLRRVRFACRTCGLNGISMARVEQRARRLLREKVAGHLVIERCAAFARELRSPPRDPGPEAA